MLNSKREKLETSTRKANVKFARAAEREAEFLKDRQKNRDADEAKAARLRALRLAKEAADREAEAGRAAEKHAAAETKRTTGKAQGAAAKRPA